MPTVCEEITRIVLTGGGTGGHVYPALAVAEALRALRSGCEILYIGGDRMESEVVPAAGIAFRAISVHGLAGRGFIGLRRRLRAVGELAIGLPLMQSLLMLRAFRPKVVIGTGGYASGPVILAARLLGLRSLALDGNRVPGHTSRLVARLVDVFGVADPELAERFARRMRRGGRVEVTGLPIRADLPGISREAGAKLMDLDPERKTVLALGGSLGSRRINEAIRGAVERLAEAGGPGGLQIVHSTGARFAPSAAVGGAGAVDYRPFPYLDERYPAALAAADLVVARSGASTVAEITACGKPAVLIPWSAASTDEQAHNAEPLARAGAAVVIPDSELTAGRLAEALAAILADEAQLSRMAEASRGLGRPEAAREVARLALELADG